MASSIERLFKFLPVITLTGPRQSGKITLCHKMFANLPYANLEDAATLAEVHLAPKAFLAKYLQGVIIDETQNFPEIFSYLQVATDENRMTGGKRRFMITESNKLNLNHEQP